MSFQVTVVTPESQALDAQAKQAILPAHDGQMGILTNRAPILVRLGIGSLRVDLADGSQKTFFVDGGVAQMKDNKLTVLTTEAVASGDLDAAAARTALEEATARKTTGTFEADKRKHDIESAKAKAAIAGK